MSKTSPLSQTLTRDGKSVKIEITQEGKRENGWTLKIVDEYNNNITWEDNFSCAQMALDEALSCADEEGIDCLIGPDPKLFQ